MNSIILVGRLTKDPDIKYIGEKNVLVSTFTLAVDRNLKKEGLSKQTDFIRIETWRTLADICTNSFKKGSLVSIKGTLRIDEYKDKDGSKKYMTKVVADSANLLKHSNKVFTACDVFENENINLDESALPF